MPSSMLVHDTRLSGTAPAIARNTYLVNESVPLNDALGWIATYARMQGGLTQMSIMCHDDTINFGGWEGQLYRFSPDGTVELTVGKW